MIFEKKSLHVVLPLDPTEGPRYIEPVYNYESDDSKQMYCMGQRELLHIRFDEELEH